MQRTKPVVVAKMRNFSSNFDSDTPRNYFHLRNVLEISNSPFLEVVLRVVQPQADLDCVVLAAPVENIFHNYAKMFLF